jgi:hypothetical protein
MAALWLFAAVMVPFSAWPGGAFVFWENELTPLLIFYFVIAGCATNVDECMSLVKAMCLCGFFLCFEIIFLCTPSVSRGLTGTHALDRNDLALTLVYIFPFVLTVLQTGRKFERVWALCLAALLFGSIVRTGSRGGVIGLFFVVLASTFLHGAKRWKKVLVISLCIGSIFFFSKNLTTRFEAVWNGTDYNYSEGRIKVWEEGAGLFVSHLITGVGAGQFGTASGMTYGPASWRAPHDVLLEIGVELGIPGLILFIVIVYSVWENTRKGLAAISAQRNTRMKVLLLNTRISLLGFLVSGLFLSQAYSPLVPFLLAFSSGLASSALTPEEVCVRFPGQGPSTGPGGKMADRRRPVAPSAQVLRLR